MPKMIAMKIKRPNQTYLNLMMHLSNGPAKKRVIASCAFTSPSAAYVFSVATFDSVALQQHGQQRAKSFL